jgi:hypothetical protein
MKDPRHQIKQVGEGEASKMKGNKPEGSVAKNGLPTEGAKIIDGTSTTGNPEEAKRLHKE